MFRKKKIYTELDRGKRYLKKIQTIFFLPTKVTSLFYKKLWAITNVLQIKYDQLTYLHNYVYNSI